MGEDEHESRGAMGEDEHVRGAMGEDEHEKVETISLDLDLLGDVLPAYNGRGYDGRG